MKNPTLLPEEPLELRKALKGQVNPYGVQSFNNMLIGRWLHTYADSFAHQGFSAYWTDLNKSKFDTTLPAIGHAQAGHFPDYPYTRLNVAIEAAHKIYELLPERGKVVAWKEVEADLTKALSDPKNVYTVRWGAFARQEPAPYTLDQRVEALQKLIKARFNNEPKYDKSSADEAEFRRWVHLDLGV
jgi:hypothetical protein